MINRSGGEIYRTFFISTPLRTFQNYDSQLTEIIMKGGHEKATAVFAALIP